MAFIGFASAGLFAFGVRETHPRSEVILDFYNVSRKRQLVGCAVRTISIAKNIIYANVYHFGGHSPPYKNTI